MSIYKTSLLPNGWDTYVIQNKTFFRNKLDNTLSEEIPSESLYLPKNWLEIYSFTKNHPYFYNILSNKSYWYIPVNNCAIKGLLWIGQSCYLDSTLVALFSQDTDITYSILNNKVIQLSGKPRCGIDHTIDIQNRKNIQIELIRIWNMIRGSEQKPEYCTDLRKMLESCPHSEKFHLEKTADSGEFLSYIFGLFNIPSATTNTITYGTNSSEKIVPNDELIVTSEINNNNASPIKWVFKDLLKSNYHLQTTNLLTHVEDNYPHFFQGEDMFKMTNEKNEILKYFTRKISVTTYTKAPSIIFCLERINTYEGFIDRNVYIDQEIQLNDETKLKLSSLVLYRPGHYIAAILCGGYWYCYNDVNYKENGMVLLGSFDNMIEITKANTTATQIYYTPI